MANGVADVCICVLFYGADDKHYKLAERVLNEPLQRLAERNVEFRFGCNAVGPATTALLQRQIADYFRNARVFHSHSNIMKYPSMRHMFHVPTITAPITMWFDHDSYLAPDLDANLWLARIRRQLAGCDMIGSVHKAALSAAQTAWLADQPWKTSNDLSPYVTYALGSWWALNTPLLYKYDWPPSNLQQKGGDILFGELFRQQNLLLCHFRDGVRINVNDAGVESAIPRTVA